jgi:hypothetical protein
MNITEDNRQRATISDYLPAIDTDIDVFFDVLGEGDQAFYSRRHDDRTPEIVISTDYQDNPDKIRELINSLLPRHESGELGELII